MQQAPQVSFASQAPAPSPSQYPAPYSPYGVTPTSTMAEMLDAFMPIIMLVLLMSILMPVMKGVTAGAS